MSFMPLGTRLLKRSTDLKAELADLGFERREAPQGQGHRGRFLPFLYSPEVRSSVMAD